MNILLRCNLKDFLKIYESISSIEALNNSLELKQLTKLAKDSINIEILSIIRLRRISVLLLILRLIIVFIPFQELCLELKL